MKKILGGILIALSLTYAPVLAADQPQSEKVAETSKSSGIQWSGDIAIKYERDTMEGEDNTDGLIYTLRLNGEKELFHGFSLYTRLGAQYATAPEQSDFNTVAYETDKKGVVAIDLFGLKYHKGAFDYKLGRQDVTIGKTALLYSRSDSNIGVRNFVDGLSFAGTSGKASLNGIFAQEDNDGGNDNRLAAIHGGYNFNKTWNMGVTIGRYINETDDGKNSTHLAVDGTYTIGKHTITAEFAKSNLDGDNKAYAITWEYAFNDKTSAYVKAFRVEPNADMGGQSDFDTNNRGYHYGVIHKFTKDDTVEIKYENQKTLRDDSDHVAGSHNTEVEINLTHSF